MKFNQESQVILRGLVLRTKNYMLDGSDVSSIEIEESTSCNMSYTVLFNTGEQMNIVLHKEGFKLSMGGFTLSGVYRLMMQRWINAVTTHITGANTEIPVESQEPS